MPRGLVWAALPHLASRSLRLSNLDRFSTAFQDARPIEVDLRVVLFDQPDGIFVERGAPDLHARRRTKPIKDARPRTPTPFFGMHDESVLVSTLVAAEPQIRQGYFLF